MGEIKTLYFEGAGWVPRGEVENCRIRTAFKTDKGEAIYLELTGFEVGGYRNKEIIGGFAGQVDHCHYITKDDNQSFIPGTRDKIIGYTKVSILNFVNSLGCSFDEIVVLPDFSGYRVHKDDGGYNYGDKFVFSPELTERRKTKVAELKKYFKELFNQKYDNTSYDIENGNLTVCLNVSEGERKAAGYMERQFIVEV